MRVGPRFPLHPANSRTVQTGGSAGENDDERARAVAIFHGVDATALAVALLFAVAASADTYDLPFIHGLTLAHGSIFVVFPVYFALSYFFLLPVAWRLRRVDPVPAQRVPVLAIHSLLPSGNCVLIPFVGSVLGLMTGHLALRRCKNDPQVTGVGIALVGLAVGYLLLAYEVYVVGMVSSVALRISN